MKTPQEINVLVACEESQAVCKALRARGFNAFSNDIQECSGGHPEWHLQMDCFEAIKLKQWDLMIAHPPCTYLSNAGAARLYPKAGKIDLDRYNKGMEAKVFFESLLKVDIPFIAVENPIQSKVFGIVKYDQTIQPWQFGHPYSKKTCLWLKNLPKLNPTKVVTENVISWVSGGSKDSKGNPRKQIGLHNSAKERSKTFPGIAEAMASQWGDYLLTELNK